MTIIFFGSFQSYSVQVLEKLHQNFDIIAVITTPPAPAGRSLQLKKTEVHEYSEQHKLTLLALPSLDKVPTNLTRPDFIVVAGYGKFIPQFWLDFPRIAPLNMHASLLPNYRGAFPAEWAILNGETQTGVTILEITPEFDKGAIYAQATLPILPTDTRQTLYTKLYNLGANLLITTLPKIATGAITPTPQPPGNYFYAKKITRNDGFIPWSEFKLDIEHCSLNIQRKHRAFAGWPGTWTITPKGHRLKLISLTPLLVQLAGQTPQPMLSVSANI